MADEELELAPQAAPVDAWHAYGPGDDGTFYVHGPSAADPELAATLGQIVGLPYLRSFDHEPTPDELRAVVR